MSKENQNYRTYKLDVLNKEIDRIIDSGFATHLMLKHACDRKAMLDELASSPYNLFSNRRALNYKTLDLMLQKLLFKTDNEEKE